MSSSYRKELDKWLAQLDVKADMVLDIGGAQLPVQGRTKSWDVKDYKIADLSSPHADSPKPEIVMDINKLNTDPFQVDLIFCLEVFDYVWNPHYAFVNISNMLKLGGRAWVTFPSFYPTHNPIEDDALLYKEGGIKKLADVTNLNIIQMIKRRPETDAVEQVWRRERMRAAKHYDHNFTGFIVEFQK